MIAFPDEAFVDQTIGFPQEYQVHLLDELPSGDEGHRYYYPDANQNGGKDGLLVRVTLPSSEQSWVGVFEFGDRSEQLASGYWPHPHRFTICVVARGRGYFVDARNPKLWSEVISFPVTAVVPVVAEGLLLFADFTKIAAYASEGLLWRTRELSWDGLQIVAVESGRLIGFGHDPTLRQPVEFTVDIKTGIAAGGSNRGKYVK